jgi:hypothetical protein
VNAPERVFLRPIGNPLPLGFLALAGATMLVSGLQLGPLDPRPYSEPWPLNKER